ncbi:prepilin peptidase [Patescibacteria group bacterium]|nr:prepilin peptidase [Patescibacteria group bacterium]
MTLFFVIASILLGCIVASFLNVIALRYNTGRGIGGRSMCFSCGHALGPRDLVPLISFIIQRGRCRYCGSRISVDNIYAEITGGLVFGLISARGLFLGISDLFHFEYLVSTLFLMVVFSVLLVIFFYDMKHKIIPDRFSFIFSILALVGGLWFDFGSNGFYTYAGFSGIDFWRILAGIVVPLPFLLIWLVSQGRWIGLGDPKLMIGIGFLLGVARGFSAVVMGFWIGAIVAGGIALVGVLTRRQLLGRGKPSIMKAEIPFAPFLIVGTLVAVVTSVNFFPW